jgi:hypothetical protein
MFTIRKQHMDACATVSMRNFEDRVLEHLRESYPGEVETRGELKTREAIREGTQKARGYGLVSEVDVVLYIDVMFRLGPDFDNHPKYPWAREILQGLDNQDPATKAVRLDERASALGPQARP